MKKYYVKFDAVPIKHCISKNFWEFLKMAQGFRFDLEVLPVYCGVNKPGPTFTFGGFENRFHKKIDEWLNAPFRSEEALNFLTALQFHNPVFGVDEK